MINKLVYAGGAAPPPSGTLLTDTFSATFISTDQTFNNVNINTASSNRNIVLVLGFSALNNTTDVTGITVNGVSMTLYYGTNISNSTSMQTIIASGLVTTGALVDIVVSCTDSSYSIGCAVYASYISEGAFTLVDDVSSNENTNTNSYLTDIAIQLGGVLFYGCADRNANTSATITWTGTDNVVDQPYVSMVRTLHHGFIECTETTTTDDLLISVSGTDKVARQSVSFI